MFYCASYCHHLTSSTFLIFCNNCNIGIVVYRKNFKLTWRVYTAAERIASETRKAGTNWTMIDNITLRVRTTTTRTYVATFLIDTRQMTRTFRINCTFRSTIWRNPDIGFHARTRRGLSADLTYGVRTARIRHTWIFLFSF